MLPLIGFCFCLIWHWIVSLLKERDFKNSSIFMRVVFRILFLKAKKASRILLTELTVQRCPIDMRGYAMGTVTSLTAVSRSLCDVIIASLLQFHDLMPLYVGAVLCAAASAICYSTHGRIKLKKSWKPILLFCQKWCACKTNLHSNKNDLFELCYIAYVVSTYSKQGIESW